MGAEVSKPVKKKTISPDWIFRSENELVAYFNDRAIQQCTAPELAAFRYNIRNADLGRVVDKRQIARLYQLPDSNSVLAAQFHRIIENLTAYPLLGQRRRGASYIGCLKAYVLLEPVRGTKYTELKTYDQAALFFMLLSVEPDEMSPDRQRLHGREIVENFNELDLEQLSVPAVEMLEFVSFLLLLSRYFARPNTKIEDMVYDELTKTYENQVMNIIRTMNPEIATQYDLETRDITLTQFTDAVKTVFPNLLQPLELFMEQIFYQKRNLISSNKDLKGSFTTRLTSGALIAQIATYWPRELVYGKMQKLYIGRESGYSMRSFQSKVFKWMAPTMIILAGTRIHCDGEFAEDSQRYNRFIHEFPRFKDAQTDLDPALKRKKRVMYVVYVNEPWKVTNKELFGDCETTIVQLSPVQEVFRAQNAPNMYFNTLGGGIGVGNVQPLIKGAKKKYYPGDVSLTIDPSMEFGVLRHVGQCGMFSPGMLWTQRGEEDKTFEIRFTIEDIEAWGYGGEGEANEQIRLWEWEEAEAQRRRNINLHSLDEDRALLQMAGLVGQHQSGGSM